MLSEWVDSASDGPNDEKSENNLDMSNGKLILRIEEV